MNEQKISKVTRDGWSTPARWGVLCGWATPLLLIWLPVVPLWLFIKEEILANRGYGFLINLLQRDVGRGGVHTALSLLERLSLFRWDLALSLVVIPLLLVTLLGRLPSRWRPALMGLVSLASLGFLFVQFRCLATVGTFQSRAMLLEALVWSRDNPELARQYVTLPLRHLKMVAGITVMLSVIGSAQWTQCWVWRRSAAAGFGGLYLAILIFVGVTFLPVIPRIPYHQDILTQSVKAFFGWNRVDDPALRKLTPAELAERFAELSQTRRLGGTVPFQGKATDYDVLWFVMETTPDLIFQPADDIESLPNFNRLKQHALILANHHTTFMHTLPAIYSMLTSSYPVDLEQMEVGLHGRAVHGFMRGLAERGYDTAFYCPDRLSARFETLLQGIGVKKIQAAGEDARKGQSCDEPTVIRLRRDRAVLQDMLAGMKASIDAKRHYGIMFLPQIGHAPWSQLPDFPPVSDRLARGRQVVQLLDRWLGEILGLLEQSGRLDKTIIVVTGDHGVRNRLEDPDFRIGSLDERTFHVPCMIYAPGLLERPVAIDELTSHIDLTPTLVELCGLDYDRAAEEGLPVWDAGLRQRRLFFWGRDITNADGFHDGDRYYVTGPLMGDGCSAGPRLIYNELKPLPANSAEATAAESTVTRLWALQHRWCEVLPQVRK